MSEEAKNKAKLSAFDCWRIRINNNLSDEEYKSLLIENGIIITKSNQSN